MNGYDEGGQAVSWMKLAFLEQQWYFGLLILFERFLFQPAELSTCRA